MHFNTHTVIHFFIQYLFNTAHFELHEHYIHCVDIDKIVVTLEENMYSFYIQTRNWRNGPIKEGGLKFSADMKFIQDKSGECQPEIISANSLQMFQ